jgi:hypothetical protein
VSDLVNDEVNQSLTNSGNISVTEAGPSFCFIEQVKGSNQLVQSTTMMTSNSRLSSLSLLIEQ